MQLSKGFDSLRNGSTIKIQKELSSIDIVNYIAIGQSQKSNNKESWSITAQTLADATVIFEDYYSDKISKSEAIKRAISLGENSGI
jgi:hypothetical protein